MQGVYFIAVAGVLYDIIRGVPFIGADAKGNPVFINTSSGTQFGVEGVIIGALSECKGGGLEGRCWVPSS